MQICVQHLALRLHCTNSTYLIFCSTVVVEDSDAAAEGHGDGHVGFGHGVHRRGDQRGPQGDFLTEEIIF